MLDANVPKPAKITQAKGKPWIYWVGKRGLEEVPYFPAQETERFDPDNEIGKGRWSNLLFHGDNKEVMGHLLHKYRGQVDLIYIDPPFDSKADYVRKVQLRGLASKRLSGEEQNLLEQIQYNDLWANDEYLQFMYDRLILLKELMSNKSSIYLHCDWRQSHRLRCVMDEVFGDGGPEKKQAGFKNEIIWQCGRMGAAHKVFATAHNSILFYTKTDQWYWDAPKVPYAESLLKTLKKDEDGYYYTRGKMGRKMADWEIEQGIGLKTYVDPEDGKAADDVWGDVGNYSAGEYPTQKPPKLIERLIAASCPPDGLVMDIFCGSGMTGVAAQKLGRRWILADMNHGAIQTSLKSLQGLTRKGGGPGKSNLPASRSIRIFKVNDYDLQIQHNEALEFAIDKIGIQRTPQDGFFEGVVGDRLVKIIPLSRPANVADLDSIDREIADIRPDDTRDILVVALGAETNVRPWIDEKNKLRQHAGNTRYELKHLRETGFFEHRPAEADIAVKKEGDKVKVEIRDFHSPTICSRLDIANDRAVIRAEIPDFRSQIDRVMIDLDYDGKVFDIDFSDLPPKKTDLTAGSYVFGTSECGTTIAVKVIDMLGEEVLTILSLTKS